MSPISTEALSPSIDHLISKRSKSRTFRHFGLADLEGAPANFKPHPKPLSLSFGKPNEQYFPIDKITVNVDNYPFQKTLFPNDILEENSITIERNGESLQEIGIDEALQYGEVNGLPAFRDFLLKFTEKVNKPNYHDWDLIPTNGSGDGLNKAADAILDPNDVILLEEFTFIPFTNAIRNVGAIPVPTKLNFDKGGDFNVEYLQDLLENWHQLKPNLKKPKALYLIPTCQNPTGLTHSYQTREKIYELAQIHDFIIIEDDPYGYLTLPPVSKPDLANIKDFDISVDDYLANHLNHSYLKLDTHGRVLRLETLSKVFAPGLRLGFIVAHSNVIKSIRGYSNIVTRAPSGTSQLIFTNIVTKKFGGVDGYLKWILKMRLAYIHRRNVLIHSIITSKAYESNYLSIINCDSGMFAGIKLNFPQGTDNVEKLKLLNFKFLQYGVNVVLGFKMAVDLDFSHSNANFLRICFAAAENDLELQEAGSRLSNAVFEFFQNDLQF